MCSSIYALYHSMHILCFVTIFIENHNDFDMYMYNYSFTLISIPMFTYAQGEHVPEREFHVATEVKNRIVVFGGRSDVFAPCFLACDVYPNDFFYYELGEYICSTDVHCT